MSDNYFKSIYKSLKNLSTIDASDRDRNIQYKSIIKNNEILLNEITKYTLLGTISSNLIGGGISEQFNQIQLDLIKAIEDLINKCNEGNTKEIANILRSLLRYIDLLYVTVKDVDIEKIRNQLTELQEMIKSLE